MTNPKRVREWFINPIVGYKCEVNENGIGLTGNEIHVIEMSAYQELLAQAEALAVRVDGMILSLQKHGENIDPEFHIGWLKNQLDAWTAFKEKL